jgi:hypothetical protein
MTLPKILIAIVLLLSVLFAGSLFKNIGYPLLWEDEANIVMRATRVLEYGYPKISCGKNVFRPVVGSPSGKFVENEKRDAYSAALHGEYYLSAIGVFLARNVDDIYIKTAILRIPFAVIGFIGVFIMGLSCMSLFKKNLSAKLLFLICFIFLELLSISLTLHLREARYHSMTIFFSACICYVYINYRLLKKINPVIYILVMTLLLLLLFNAYLFVYFVFLIAIGLYECLDFLKRRRINDFAVGMAPLLISLIPTIPLLVFLKVFDFPGEYATACNVTFNTRCRSVFEVFGFFQKYEFLYLVLTVKIALAFLWFYVRRSGIPTPSAKEKLSISNFLGLFFIIYILMIINLPYGYIFRRYFIVLQPILVVILLLDIFIVFELISHINFLILKRGIQTIILLLICTLFMLNGSNKIGHIKNHIYELFHQYRGPLDFVIPYIKSEYVNPERLVIATNYEECAYMYYLGSKVIVGFSLSNLEEDLKMRPDIIIPRKNWGANPMILNAFFQNERYKKISFPVFDYPVNNIPEPGGRVIPHLYKTPIAANKNNRLDIYIKQ